MRSPANWKAGFLPVWYEPPVMSQSRMPVAAASKVSADFTTADE